MLLLRITATSGENKTLKIGPLIIIIIGFGAHYTIIIVRSPQNSIDNYLGAYIIKYFIHKLAATLAVDRLLSPLLYNAYMVRRLAFPPPPPPPPMVWFARGGGGGGWRVRKGVGAVGAATGWWGGAGGQGSHTSPSQASRKPCNAARAPVSSNLINKFKPYTQP